MWFHSLLDSLKAGFLRRSRRLRHRSPPRQAPSCRPHLEALEDRIVPSFAAAVDYTIGSYPQAVALGRFDAGSTLDLVVANYSTSNVSVLLGNSNGTFQAAKNSDTGLGPLSVAVGDFNKDGNLDVVTANANDLSVLLGKGDGTFQAAQNIVLPGQFPPDYNGTTALAQRPLSAAVGDINGDGTLDLAVTATTSFSVLIGYGYYGYPIYEYHQNGHVNVLLGNGTGGFTAQDAQLLAGSYPNAAALKDFNGDSNLDLATVGYGVARVLPGNGDGTFDAPADYATDWSPQSLVVGDVNGDGINDLITRNFSSVSVLLGKGSAGVGDGTFQPAQNIALDFNPNSLAVGDINADGKLDFVATSNTYVVDGYSCGYYGCYSFGHYEGRTNVLLGHGDGTFAAPRAQTVAAAYSVAGAAGDFNGDGFADVAVANEAGNVSVLINTQDWRSFVLSGFPSPTTAGDAHTITVTALGTDLNVLTGYTGTVHFTSTDSQAVLPADYTFTAGDHGTHTFSVTLRTAGTWSLMVADTTTADFNGSQGGIVVNPAEPSKFVLTGFPSTTTSGDYGYFGVTASDAYGNRATNYTGTVHVTSSDGLATLPDDYTFTAYDYGTHYFSATLTTVGRQSLTVTDKANSSLKVTQADIRVLPRASITGPYYAARNQALTFTLGASAGLPASTAFSYAIDWNNDGVVDQTVSGPSGTTVQHSYSVSGYYYAVVTATVTVGGEDYKSYGAYQSVYVFAVSASIQADPGDATKSALVIEGSADAETIVVGPGTGNGIALSYYGYSLGTITAPGGASFAHVLVYGNGGNDTIQETGNLAVPAFLFGGDGNDTLDARGSIANNVLVGDAGNDVLYGGSGRDLLIGGLGADILRAGNGGAILIGGSTNYDANVPALLAIMKEWGRTDADYNTRVKHLNGTLTGGSNGSYFLNTTTVHADKSVDSLYGGAGLDWFFPRKKGPNKDKVFNLSSGEVVTTIS